MLQNFVGIYMNVCVETYYVYDSYVHKTLGKYGKDFFKILSLGLYDMTYNRTSKFKSHTSRYKIMISFTMDYMH